MVDSVQIIVLVTTYNRPELLEKRALKSISLQTGKFDAVVLVDNSDSEVTKKKNREIFEGMFCDGIYLINERTPGAAGAARGPRRSAARPSPARPSFIRRALGSV